MEMEALVGRVKSLFTMLALFRFLFLVWGLSFEKLARSGSPRLIQWSSRPHPLPSATPTGRHDVPDECRFAGGIDKNEWDSDA